MYAACIFTLAKTRIFGHVSPVVRSLWSLYALHKPYGALRRHAKFESIPQLAACIVRWRNMHVEDCLFSQICVFFTLLHVNVAHLLLPHPWGLIAWKKRLGM